MNNLSTQVARLNQGINESNIEYLNVNIRGSDNPEEIIDATFNENRTVPLLDDPSKWIMGLVRFNVPAKLIPIFKWRTQRPLPLADPDFLVYFTYAGITVSKAVDFIPQTNDPVNNTGRLVWNFSDFITMVNTTIQEVFTLIQTATLFPSNVRCPRLILDSTTNLISLYSSITMATGSGINMSFSKLLYAYFPALVIKEDTLLIPNREIYTFLVYDNIINNVTYLGSAGYAMLSEFPVLSLWSGVDKLLFISNTIPINTENESGQLNIQSRVIFDFILDDDQINNRTNIIYIGNTNQRWYDLLSSYPMKRTDISIEILFTDGSTKPLRLISTDFLSLKIQFVRKGSMTNLNA